MLSRNNRNNKKRRTALIAGVAAAGIAITGVGAGSLALFTDQERVFDNIVTAGDADTNFDITVTQAEATLNGAAAPAGVNLAWDGVDDGDGVEDYRDTNKAGNFRINYNNMAPGDTLIAELTVENVGGHDARYAVVPTLTQNAADANALKAADEGDAFDFGGTSTDGLAPTMADMGLKWKILDANDVLLADNDTATSVTENIGDEDAGQDTGDRALAADDGTAGSGADQEVLKLVVEYPSDATATSFGATANLDMVFHAEQTANNA